MTAKVFREAMGPASPRSRQQVPHLGRIADALTAALGALPAAGS